MAFTCPRCGRTSHHPEDEREGYCGACHHWTGERRVPAATQLRRALGNHAGGIGIYTTEAMYHVQVDCTCQLLDAVDEVTDAVTATMITDVILEKLTGEGVSAAAKRIREGREQYERLMSDPIRVRTVHTADGTECQGRQGSIFGGSESRCAAHGQVVRMELL
jgi:hypothetical protein